MLRMKRPFTRLFWMGLPVGALSVHLYAQQQSAQQRVLPVEDNLTHAVETVMSRGGTPGATAGILSDGQVRYAHAFGYSVLPQGGRAGVPMDLAMAFPIGSNSKLFTATCIMLLQERGKLTVDDPISRWFPELTRAQEITIRNLLTHTSGYPDAAPMPYTYPMITHPIDPRDLIHRWSEKPLGFEPGTRYEYSNTNYTILSLIVERASGMRFHDFLWKNVIEPLHLVGVLDLDEPGGRKQLHVQGYERHALGPMRPDQLEAPGWYFGAGELAMPVTTLLAWDDSILQRTLLSPASYDAMETEFKLKDGSGTGYGFALHVNKLANGKTVFRHGGVVSGYISENVLLPDDGLAFAALTNDFEGHAGEITWALRQLVQPAVGTRVAAALSFPTPPSSPKRSTAKDARAVEARIEQIIRHLQQGHLDRKQFTKDTNFYFDKQTIADYYDTLKPLGTLQDVLLLEEAPDAGMVFRVFRINFTGGALRLSTYTMPDGGLEQFLISRAR